VEVQVIQVQNKFLGELLMCVIALRIVCQRAYISYRV